MSIERYRCSPPGELPHRSDRSPRLAELLRDGGHDAVHTLELGLERAPDDELRAPAASQERIIISGDTDFGALLALRDRRSPSVVLFRSRHTFTADDQYALIRDHLDDIAPDLDAGAVVVITDDRIRVRRLPLLHDEQQRWRRALGGDANDRQLLGSPIHDQNDVRRASRYPRRSGTLLGTTTPSFGHRR